jgi:hypothetical protein
MLLDAAILTDRVFAVADRTESTDHVRPVFVSPFVGERKESHIWDESLRRSFLSVPVIGSART